MSVFFDSDDVKWQMLVVSVTLSESHLHASFSLSCLQAPFFPPLRHISFNWQPLRGCVSPVSVCEHVCFFVCVFVFCSALSAAVHPLRIILSQCYLHLSTSHKPAASPAIDKCQKDLKPNADITEEHYLTSQSLSLFVLPVWPDIIQTFHH